MENGSDDRKRLRRFFVSHLDAGDVAGVRWLDRGEGLFRIDWPRGGRSGFNSGTDGQIFKLWAQETGRWKPGDPEDGTIWSEWKTRVRNALHRLKKDFQEQVELGKPSDPQEPFRVYKLVPPPKSMSREQEQTNGIGLSSEETLEFFNDLDSILSTQPDTPESGEGACAPLQPMVMNIPFDNGVQTTDQSMPSLHDLGVISPIQTVTPQPSQGACALAQPLIANVPPETRAQPMDQSTAALQRELLGPFANFQDCEVQVCVLYRGVQVLDLPCTVPTGFRIFHGSHVGQLTSRQLACQIFSKDSGKPGKLFGPEEMTPVPFPDCTPHTLSPKQLDSTQKLLNGTKRGVLFQFLNGDIWACRLCESAVYWLDPNFSEVPKKLEREIWTKVFDLVQFLTFLQAYATGSDKKPLPYFKFCIGQTWNLEEPFEKNLVSVTVYQKTAAENLETVRQNKDARSLSLKFSNPNEDDHLVAGLEQLIANLNLHQTSSPPLLQHTDMQ
uniref:Interferon regulatory factor 7 n=1 Tax=Branchiostoma belcheri tsingtauense TaxID=155462 RepID=A0A0A7PCB5_BRABE|nr:interferon regulatory factor 7 [Branchiostoma belcheri tsingtauense]